MPSGNLAKVFGPTIVGYSSKDIAPGAMYSETASQVRVSEPCIISYTVAAEVE